MAVVSSSSCPMCPFEANTKALVLSHLRLVHKNDPRFLAQCSVEGCTYTGRTFNALYSHIYRNHPKCGIILTRKGSSSGLRIDLGANLQIPELTNGNEELQLDPIVTDEVEADLNHLLGTSKDVQKRSAALFLLRMKESKRLSQAAIDEIVSEWDTLFSHTVHTLTATVRSKLATAGIDYQEIEGLPETFVNITSPFEGLETRFKQEKYYRDFLGLVEPNEIVIGESYHKSIMSGVKRRLIEVQDTYQYVSLLSSLKSLVADPTVLEQIDQCPSRVRHDGILEDYCDGELFRAHPLFSSDPFALQIIAFYDELELCNPLGTHVKKHKLGILLFTLGNIHPKFRSCLRAISLVLAATAPVIARHGLDNIIEPFVDDLKVLATDGIKISVNGMDRTFRGALLCILGDNLACHALGGFKESFSFALRICRTCMVTKDDYKPLSNLKECTLRTDRAHREQCELVSGPLGEHYSKTYGINRRSVLLDIPYYSLFNGGMPHDIMHDVFEGGVALEMSLLLGHCIISMKYFTLEQYNELLVNFDYDYTESNKPSPIGSRSLLVNKHCLKLSASQSILLVRILPLLIGGLIPETDPNWKCFLKLRKVVDMVMSPTMSEDLCAVLQATIREHHQMFVDLYSEAAVIPKMHFFLHYVLQILQIGPMIRAWNMRNEAKLNVFKQAARLGNFTNIALSVANRHQRLMCYDMSASNLLESPTECGPCIELLLLSCEPVQVRDLLFNASNETSVSHPRWLKVNGIMIKKGAFTIIGSDGFHPMFGKILDILFVVGVVILRVIQYEVDYFDNHYHSFVINATSVVSYVRFDMLKDNSILHAHKIGECLYLYLKHSFL